MSDKITKSPQIRFAGFTDAWEQRKLGDMGSVAMNKRIFKDETSECGDVPFYKIGTFGGEPDAFISRELFEEYKVKYPYPEVGDILISASGSIGRTVVYQGEDEYFQDSNIVWLKHDERLDNSFLKQFYSIVKWQGLEGSTIKRLYNKNILDTDISVPYPDEQKKIGAFFGRLDNLITLHQHKLEMLKDTKKSLLQKMFPKEGAIVPEIRFAGFTDAWEQRKLGELVSIKSGWSPSNFIKSDDQNSSLFIKVDDLNYSSREQIESHMKVQANPRFIKMKKGSTIFPKRGAAIMTNKVRILGSAGYMDTNMMALEPESIDGEFLYTFIERTGIYKIADTSTIPQINNKHIEPYVIYLPRKDEQEKIGEFFKHLDNLITLHQRELNSLENLKKSLLQQMFV